MNLKTASLQTSCFRISPIWPETSQFHLFFYSTRTIGHLFVKICLSSFIIISLLHETLVAKIWNWNSKWTSSVRRYCYVHLRILLLEPLASFLSSLCVGYPVLLTNLHLVRPLSRPGMIWLLAYEKPTNHNIGIFCKSFSHPEFMLLFQALQVPVQETQCFYFILANFSSEIDAQTSLSASLASSEALRRNGSSTYSPCPCS